MCVVVFVRASAVRVGTNLPRRQNKSASNLVCERVSRTTDHSSLLHVPATGNPDSTQHIPVERTSGQASGVGAGPGIITGDDGGEGAKETKCDDEVIVFVFVLLLCGSDCSEWEQICQEVRTLPQIFLCASECHEWQIEPAH